MDQELLDLLSKGVKTEEEIKEDLTRIEKEKNKNLLKVGLLCLTLTQDYFKETIKIANKQIKDGVDIKFNKYKLREIEHYLEIGSFAIEECGKYYKIIQLLGDENVKTHCFVDRKTSEVFKPRNKESPNKKVSFDINQCIKTADWRGYYLKSVPDS